MERKNAVTVEGNPFTLVGPELQVGDQAPEFEVVGKDLQSVTLADTGSVVRVFSVVSSLDTPVCDAQSLRFSEEAAKLTDVHIYTISMDLPFAQSRWCGVAEVGNLTMLSDHRDAIFGSRYGTLIKESRLNCRAIFVVDQDDTLRHVEYVREIAQHPDYERALKAIHALCSVL